MSWYKDRLTDNMNPSQVINDAGKKWQGLALMAKGLEAYGDKKYAKKRAKITDAQKADTNSTKRYVADKNYAGKIGSAKITAGARDRATRASLKVAGIKFDATKYKTDGEYRKAIDAEMLKNKGKSITARAKVKAAAISSGGRVKAANITAGAKDRASKTQVEVANINAGARKQKTEKKTIKKAAAKLDLSGTDEEILQRLKRRKKIKDIGDLDIS